ncbi:type II toxin -antitoxin system TacA 1-like antitoxin [Achromobacter kerstersii]
MNEFAVAALTRAAQAVVQNGDVTPLTKAAQEVLAQSLIDPPPPNEAFGLTTCTMRSLLARASVRVMLCPDVPKALQ